jgi:hypothetical protein
MLRRLVARFGRVDRCLVDPTISPLAAARRVSSDFQPRREFSGPATLSSSSTVDVVSGDSGFPWTFEGANKWNTLAELQQHSCEKFWGESKVVGLFPQWAFPTNFEPVAPQIISRVTLLNLASGESCVSLTGIRSPAHDAHLEFN